MERPLVGGHNLYGIPVGILMLETRFPRPLGDMGNAATFTYPVLYHVVRGANPRRVIAGDRELLPSFIAGAKALVRAGVKVVTTNCGFLALFHRELAAAAAPVPALSSSLLAVPLVYRTLGRDRRVGILTADARRLGEEHFNAVGWSAREIPVAVEGLEASEAFRTAVLDDGDTLDYSRVRADVVAAACRLCAASPDLGAIVMECTNLPPFAEAVRRATELPVFHLVNLLDMFKAGWQS